MGTDLEVESKAVFHGEIEVDEGWLGGHGKDRYGRGAVGKVPVFALLMRVDKVYARAIPDAGGNARVPIVKGKVMPDRIVHTDGRKVQCAGAELANALSCPTLNDLCGSAESLQQDRELPAPGEASCEHDIFFDNPRDQFCLILKKCERRFHQPDPRQRFSRSRQWVKTIAEK